jgi:phage shock protein A
MFDDLRAAFHEALENFNRELRRETLPDTTDRLLRGMKQEIVQEKGELATLEEQLRKAEADSRREGELALTCRRRERMALGIGDEETAGVAAEHAAKHEGHQRVLEKKARAIEEELELRRRNVDDMIDKFTDARRQRDALIATVGRTSARQSFSTAEDLFDELDRVAEKIEGEGHRADAAATIDMDGPADLEPEGGFDSPPADDGAQLDAALAELKRRMGES